MSNTEIVVAHDNFLEMDPRTTTVITMEPTPKSSPKDASEDFDTARKNLLEIVETGKEAMSELLQLSVGSQDPEAYSALASILKTMIAANKTLLDTHKQIREINDMDNHEDNPLNINNSNVVIMTTTDMARLIKKASDEKPKV